MLELRQALQLGRELLDAMRELVAELRAHRAARQLLEHEQEAPRG